MHKSNEGAPVKDVVENLRTVAADRIQSGYKEMNVMMRKGSKLPGTLQGESIDLASATHDAYIVKCSEVLRWADNQLNKGTP
jgi:hypothetical protein